MNSLSKKFLYNYFIQSEKIYGLNTKNIKIEVKIKYKDSKDNYILNIYIIGIDTIYMYMPQL